MRAFFIWFHRWVALISTLVVLVVALSGSALVFEGAIDRGLNPGLWKVAPGAMTLSLDTLMARSAAAAAPAAHVSALTVSRTSDRAWVAQAGAVQVFIDPYTGAVKGTRTQAELNTTLPRRLHRLHTTLLASKVGGEIVGISTIISLVLVLTGVYLWLRDRIWRVRWSASWKRILFDLHHALGVIAAIVLVIITATGLVIHYAALNKLLYMLDSSAPVTPREQSSAAAGAASLSMDSVYRVATSALPGARVMFLSLPPKADQPIVVAMRFPEDHTPGGRSRVIVDRYTGAVLFSASTREAQAGTRLANLNRSAHTGDLLGKPTEVVWLLAALVLALQGVTGFAMWWNARASRDALERAAARTGKTVRVSDPARV